MKHFHKFSEFKLQNITKCCIGFKMVVAIFPLLKEYGLLRELNVIAHINN